MTKKDHLNYIKECGPFRIDCNRIIFSNDEIEILEKYGHWFAALEDGTLEPLTEKQRLFVEVANGLKQPYSLEEVTWFKYCKRKQIEEESGDSLYNTPVYKEGGFYTREQYRAQKKIMMNITNANHSKSMATNWLKR